MKKTKSLGGNLSNPNQRKNLPKNCLKRFNYFNQAARKHKRRLVNRKMKTLAMKNNKKTREKKLVFIWNWANKKVYIYVISLF